MDVMSLQTAAPAGTALGVAPVVPGSFLLGSALDLRRDMLGLCERAFQRYGDVVRFRFGPPGARMEMHMLFHPDPAHRVLAGWPANYRKENVFYSEVRSAGISLRALTAAVHPGAGEGPAPLRVVPIRRWTQGVHRSALLDARIGDRARHLGTGLPVRGATR